MLMGGNDIPVDRDSIVYCQEGDVVICLLLCLEGYYLL